LANLKQLEFLGVAENLLATFEEVKNALKLGHALPVWFVGALCGRTAPSTSSWTTILSSVIAA
jgi:hypothetical protein